ncbi:sulfite exporter TauE/SafE family protein [uncultured Cohaesibacter sp.]|uniref:sulfite exporter TauE/SafE family protein n=1 Tax=uncultured Cohaesibacter sp. TaxID=1002546 RepID=UPI0029C7A724|nr:sulfite exporter TauE/SafE family protein [uncultured Cohaesibacter sp.]
MFVDMLIPALAIFVAAAFRGITGFGYALIAAIGLSASLSPDNMIPTILINDLVLTALILSNRRTGAIDWGITPLLLVCGAIGALFGGLLAGMIDPTTTKLLVAGIVCLSALLGMVQDPPRWLAHKLLGALAAFAVGMLLAAFAVGGPLIAVWLLAGGTRRETTLGTLAIFFGAVDLFSVASRLALGQYGSDLPLMLLYTLPITLLGYGAGHLVGSRLTLSTWRRVSSIGLILIALAGALQTLAVWFT